MRKFASKALITLGIICYLFTLYAVFDRINPRRVSFAYSTQEKILTTKVQKHFPVTISIPAASIVLPVIPSQIKNGQWEATTQGVSYLKSSPLPGETGNSVLYGHNWLSLLGRLVMVKPGDKIEIYFDDNTKKVFEIEYTIIVTPDQTHILTPSLDKRITLYTCTGFLDSKRFVAVALLKE
jgi:LPXTG-site transpeptidase (sortase) family protein